MEVRFRLYRNSKRLFNECKWSDQLVDCNEDSIEELLMSAYMVLNSAEGVQINYTSDNITIYANDLEVIDEMKNHQLSKNVIRILEANISVPEGCIYRKNSKYKYRIILKRNPQNKHNKKNLILFAKIYNEYVKISSGFEWFLNTPQLITAQTSYHFDINDQSLSTMFDLIVPGSRLKTVRIISDKYNTEE